jgi:hypothetical protein
VAGELSLRFQLLAFFRSVQASHHRQKTFAGTAAHGTNEPWRHCAW